MSKAKVTVKLDLSGGLVTQSCLDQVFAEIRAGRVGLCDIEIVIENTDARGFPHLIADNENLVGNILALASEFLCGKAKDKL